MKQYVIINLTELHPDHFGNEHIIPPNRRPSYVHDSLEDAEKEALRLQQKHASEKPLFIIFESVARAVTRMQSRLVTEPVAMIESLGP